MYSRFTELRPAGEDRLRRTESSIGPSTNSPERVTVLADSVVGLRQGPAEFGGAPTMLDDLRTHVASTPDRALVLARAASALRLDAPVTSHGVVHDVVSFPWGARRLRIEISRETRLPVAVEVVGTYPHDFRRAPFGDVRVRTAYTNWTLQPNGVTWPMQAIQTLDGERFRETTIAAVAFDTAAPADSFAVSDSARALYAANARTAPSAFRFGMRGAPQPLREGIVRLRDFWTMTAVRQRDGIVLFEAHLSGDYLAQVIDWAAKEYPGTPVKAIVLTSDPWAHVGGVREAVARGIPIYANARSLPFLRRIASAPHTSSPDRLAKSPRAPRFVPVTARTAIGTGANRIELFPVGGAYAERMLMAYFPEQRLLYGADLVFANRPPAKGYLATPLADLRRAVERERLAVDSVFSVQATPVVAWRELIAPPVGN
jgi:glyoxylase-like metal-dependent hydrolase (beta-lactamase superfamily II)